MKIIDTHAHLYLKEFLNDFDDILNRAKQYLDYVLLPNIDMKSVADMHNLMEREPNFCFPMMGLHPCSVKNDFEKVLSEMELLLNTNKYIAIGETGLDLYWDKTTLDIQKESLKQQILWAKKYRLPIVLHCRESFEPTIELIEQYQDGSLTGVFHCFGGTKEEADRIINVGFYVGIGGVATYKKCDVATVLPQIDPKKIVLETDCPYLAPVPHRGKRNEPSFISHVAQKVAESMGKTYQEVVNSTHQNALDLFTLLPSNAQAD